MLEDADVEENGSIVVESGKWKWTVRKHAVWRQQMQLIVVIPV
jgi:hypothetical protein